MIIVDTETFNAMHLEYVKWRRLYDGDSENVLQRAINSLLESLGTIIQEARIEEETNDD
jgi:hypothetical protein